MKAITHNPLSKMRKKQQKDKKTFSFLRPGEMVIVTVRGFYHGGPATLIATNQRVILYDKRAFYTYVEDYDMSDIVHAKIAARFISAKIAVTVHRKTLVFSSYAVGGLKELQRYIHIVSLEMKASKSHTELADILASPVAKGSEMISEHVLAMRSTTLRPT